MWPQQRERCGHSRERGVVTAEGRGCVVIIIIILLPFFPPQGSEGSGTQAEYALQVQVQQLSRQVTEYQRRLDEQRRHYEQRLERDGGGGARGGVPPYQNVRGDHPEMQNLCGQVRTIL